MCVCTRVRSLSASTLRHADRRCSQRFPTTGSPVLSATFIGVISASLRPLCRAARAEELPACGWVPSRAIEAAGVAPLVQAGLTAIERSRRRLFAASCCRPRQAASRPLDSVASAGRFGGEHCLEQPTLMTCAPLRSYRTASSRIRRLAWKGTWPARRSLSSSATQVKRLSGVGPCRPRVLHEATSTSSRTEGQRGRTTATFFRRGEVQERTA